MPVRRFRGGVPAAAGWSPYRRAAKRPMEKKIVTVSHAVTSGGQVSTTLMTATYPFTLTGLRWDLSAIEDTNGGGVAWAIVVVREGASADTLSVADGAALYQPESNVVAAGVFEVPASTTNIVRLEGSTKAMRKMQGGDTLQFLTLGSAAPTADLRGTIQFFAKV